ncbi:MAG TPA: hypothetical protein VL528_03030 [Oxalicibacterium sp.]|nr:hypothetical protein [Oxalicibacterium sp.]
MLESIFVPLGGTVESGVGVTPSGVVLILGGVLSVLWANAAVENNITEAIAIALVDFFILISLLSFERKRVNSLDRLLRKCSVGRLRETLSVMSNKAACTELHALSCLHGLLFINEERSANAIEP